MFHYIKPLIVNGFFFGSKKALTYFFKTTICLSFYCQPEKLAHALARVYLLTIQFFRLQL